MQYNPTASFKLRGKPLRPVMRIRPVKEKVFSITDFSYEDTKKKSSLINTIFKNLKSVYYANNKYLSYTMVVMAVFTAAFLIFNPPTLKTPVKNKYFIFSSKPLTLVQSDQDVDSRDSRAQKINEVFRYYNCPLEGLGEVFVNEADKNDIPWWLVASVAFQESSCGKNTPKIDGSETYNAWGWGVYGSNIHSFDNWARGVEVISSYFKTRFFDQGIKETCEIMKIYTPPSNGSWCEGVNHFAAIIQNYKTP